MIHRGKLTPGFCRSLLNSGRPWYPAAGAEHASTQFTLQALSQQSAVCGHTVAHASGSHPAVLRLHVAVEKRTSFAHAALQFCCESDIALFENTGQQPPAVARILQS